MAELEAFLTPRLRSVIAPGFDRALAYPVFSGGKRMRPAWVFAAYEAIVGPDADRTRSLPAAAAVELVHTYSLVHDDLPSMDDDDERRGRPTVHVQFDEATAVLVGDALLTLAFDVLTEGDLPPHTLVQQVRTLARAAGASGMVGGQILDLGLSGGSATLEALTALHRAKTGALIAASCQLGGLAAGADADTITTLGAYGEAVGLGFQLVDDLLDAGEDDASPSVVRAIGADATRALAEQTEQQALQAARSLPRPEVLEAMAAYTVQRKV
ncbi:MAG: polyprenyl synthetase family protein [Myxococcota bacterium]